MAPRKAKSTRVATRLWAHSRLIVSLIVGIVVGVFVPLDGVMLRILAAWNVAGWLYIALLGVMMVRCNSLGEVNKGLQAIAAEVTDYSKKSFEDGTRAFQQLLGAKSFEHVMEIQYQYARMAYEAYVAELTKLGNMYAGLTRTAFKPVEQAAAKVGSPNRLRSS